MSYRILGLLVPSSVNMAKSCDFNAYVSDVVLYVNCDQGSTESYTTLSNHCGQNQPARLNAFLTLLISSISPHNYLRELVAP